MNMHLPLAAVALALLASPAIAQETGTTAPTTQNDPNFLKKTDKDPAFAGAEAPGPKNSKAQPQQRPADESMSYTPTKQPEEGTQQPK
jgi:hypothetical protein